MKRGKILLGLIFVSLSIIVPMYFIGYSILKKEIQYKYNYDKSDKYFVYDVNGNLDVVYGVWFRNEIKYLINYYKWKLDGEEYKYDDISPIMKISNNSIVYAQEYLKDSTIVYVTLKYYDTYREDSITMNYYVLRSMLHEMPIEDRIENLDRYPPSLE